MSLATTKAAISAWMVTASGIPGEQVVWAQNSIGLRLPAPYITLRLVNIRQIGQPERQTATRLPPYEVSVASVVNSTEYALRVGDDDVIAVASGGSATNDSIVAALVAAFNDLDNGYTAAATGTAGSKVMTVDGPAVALDLFAIDASLLTTEYPLEERVDNSHELKIRAELWGGEDPTTALADVRNKAALPSFRRALRAAGVGLGELGAVSEMGGVLGPNDLGLRASMDITAFARDRVTERVSAVETVRVTDNAVTPSETFEVTVGS